MPAIINHKICDNASACGGIEVCPVGAFTYNEETKKIEIDNTKCISCGACERACPIGAIGVARTHEELEELKQAIEEDPRSAEDLFVDRYGADFVNESVIIETGEIKEKIKTENCLIELNDENNINCLLKSITYAEILEYCTTDSYYRCLVENADDVKSLNVSEFPCLLVCKNGAINKIISGYFEESDKQELFKQLKN